MLILKILNTGKGTNENADYVYQVYINNEEISHGSINGHNREDGWAKLVMEISKKEIGEIENENTSNN